MLAGADLHLVGLAEVAEAHAVLRVRGVGGLHGDGGHAVGVALRDVGHLVERLALGGRRSGDVVQRHAARQAALVVLAFGVVLDLLARDHLTYIHAGLLG